MGGKPGLSGSREQIDVEMVSKVSSLRFEGSRRVVRVCVSAMQSIKTAKNALQNFDGCKIIGRDGGSSSYVLALQVTPFRCKRGQGVAMQRNQWPIELADLSADSPQIDSLDPIRDGPTVS